MKRAIVLAGLTAMVTSSASAALIAAWDFQTTTNGGTAVSASPNSPLAYTANFGSGMLYLDGTHGSSTWFVPATGSTNTEVNAFAGTALNADTGIGMSTVTSGAASLALVGGQAGGGTFAANGKAIVFAFDMTNMTNLEISYATQRTGTGFTSQLWEYSTDGVNWNLVGDVTGIQSSFTASGSTATTLSLATGLDNAAQAFLRVTFTGVTSNTGNNRLDNIQFNADIIPAPGVLGVLGIAGIIGTRRRRA